jgi:capsular exopolysaccharide synthesis family protein
MAALAGPTGDVDRIGQRDTDAPGTVAFDTEVRAAAAEDVMRPAPVAATAVVDSSETRADSTGSAGSMERADNAADSLFARIDARFSEKVIIDADMMPASREQYRRLAAVLHDGQGESGLKVVMIASAVAGEGKTLTASNLALTFSESYRRRVLLVDGDLRRPVIHSVFRLHPASGLSEGLKSMDSKLVVRQVSPCLSVLPGGRPDADPMAGLTSSRMRRLVAEAKEAFDWVIIDTPPLVLLPDAHLLASMVDGVVLVVRANSTPHPLVKRVVDSLGRDRIVGVVLNATSSVPAGADAYYYNYSSPPQLAQARTQP